MLEGCGENRLPAFSQERLACRHGRTILASPDGLSKEHFVSCADADLVSANGFIGTDAAVSARGEPHLLSKLFNKDQSFALFDSAADYNRDGKITGADAKFALRDSGGLCTMKIGLVDATTSTPAVSVNRFGSSMRFNSVFTRPEVL